MKKIWISILAGTALMSACNSRDVMEAHEYWVRSGLKDGNSAAYMILHNHTTANDILEGASSDAAQVVELHESRMGADGIMQMIPQSSIPIGAGKEVELKPGGLHVMLIGLKQDLNAGDEISLTLYFESGNDITLTVPVKDATGMGGAGMDGHMP